MIGKMLASIGSNQRQVYGYFVDLGGRTGSAGVLVETRKFCKNRVRAPKTDFGRSSEGWRPKQLFLVFKAGSRRQAAPNMYFGRSY